MFTRWEKSFLNVIEGRSKGFGSTLLKGLLWFFSLFYQLGLLIRRGLFHFKFKKSRRPTGPLIISIGNIAVGGTGKTPATMLIARHFYPETKIAFLSRGYRSLAEKEETPTLLSKGNGPIHSALYCGDEPCIISENFPKALSYVGKRRDLAADMAEKAGAQLILLDDGLQHLALDRDLDVVVIDSNDPFGQGHLLPRGKLREEPEALKRADLIILNHAKDPKIFEELKGKLALYSGAPIIGTVYETDGLFGFNGRRIETIENRKIGLFCSIANPQNFEKVLASLDSQIIDRYIIPDHQIFDLIQLQAYVKECRKKGADLIVCTEKDKVKLVGSLSASIPIAWLKIRMRIVQGETEWNAFIERVRNSLIHN